MVNFLLLTLLAVTWFDVPLKGSLLALSAGALLYVISATATGMLMSSFMQSQVAVIFGTAIATLIPAIRTPALSIRSPHWRGLAPSSGASIRLLIF
jgi:ribosome-dependent ATPase